MDALCQLLGSKTSLPHSKLQEFVSRIEAAERLLASVAIEDAVAARGAVKRIDQARQQLALGDGSAIAGSCSTCITHYKNAWNIAEHAVLVQSVQVDALVHIEVLGDANKTYVVEATTNLINWTTLGSVKAGSDGVVQFDTGDASQYSWRFYRIFSP